MPFRRMWLFAVLLTACRATPPADSTVVGVAVSGQLSLLGTVPTVSGAHCVAADDRGNAYVCDPDNGDLLVIADALPKSGS